MKKILFMEDEPTIREVLAEYMKMQNYEGTEVQDGEKAVKALEGCPFDMAVLDIMVPKKKRSGGAQPHSEAVSGYGGHYAHSPGG